MSTKNKNMIASGDVLTTQNNTYSPLIKKIGRQKCLPKFSKVKCFVLQVILSFRKFLFIQTFFELPVSLPPGDLFQILYYKMQKMPAWFRGFRSNASPAVYSGVRCE